MTQRHKAGPLERAVMKSARNAVWLTTADYATLRLARHLAAQLDRLERAADEGAPQLELLESEPDDLAIAGKVAYIAATLLAYLKELRLTVGARGATGASPDDPAAVVRDIKSRLVSGGPVSGG